MGKYLSTFDTLADYEAATSELGYPNVSLIKADGSIIYAKNAPTPQSPCSIIVPDISTYEDTTYDSAFSVSDAKWYMLNNLNEYEEYGVYDIVEDISTATTYEGKLAVVSTTEYQYSDGSWNEVGTYEDASVTYTIDNTNPSPYVGQELSTTFKIPTADFEELGGLLDFTIRTQDGGILAISIGGLADYYYEGSSSYQGTVTNDGEYFYLSLPSEAPSSIVISKIQYWNSTPIHLIVGSIEATVEYVEKATPSYSIYNTVEEMEAVSCPNVGINEYAFVGNDLYKYFANEEWSEVEYSDPKMVAFYENEDPLLVYGNGELTQGETKIKGISPISVYIGDSVTSIGENAFDGCSGLTSVTIGSGVTTIGNDAFYGCRSLTSIEIPNSVTSIGGSAFSNCSRLTNIDIPSGVTSIGGDAFNDTPWWNTYSADTSHHYGNIVYINDVAYKATSSGITSCTFREGTVSIGGNAFYSCSRLTSVDIPSGVTSIGNYAFNGCTSLTSIDIPNSVTTISDGAFQNCSGLTSIEIPSGVTSIGDSTFNGCKSLTSIDIPNSVTTISDGAFQNCRSLTSVNIPDSVTTIGYAPFYNCTSLTSITVEATTPPTLGEYAFDSTNDCPIYVPSASVNAYKAAWSTYASRIQAIS